MWLSLVYFWLFPLTVTIFSYKKVFKKIREHNFVVAQTLRSQGAGNSTISSNEIRICRSLFIVVFAFMLCWIPAWVITILTRFRIVGTMPREFELLCTFCLNMSNTINPFIYAGMNSLFRKEFRKLLCCGSGGLVQQNPATSNERPTALLPRKEAQTAHSNGQWKWLLRSWVSWLSWNDISKKKYTNLALDLFCLFRIICKYLKLFGRYLCC